MIPTEIRTARLLLRKPRVSDLEDLHEIMSDPRVMRYWSTPEYAHLSQTETRLAEMIGEPVGEADDFLIEYQGRVIGKAGAWRLPEVGFLLHHDQWRKGFGREAMVAVINHLFAHYPVAALTAEADPRNEGCLGLLGSLGFQETHRAERTLLWRDEWCDSVYLALQRGNWTGA